MVLVEFKFCYNDASHERETSLAYISLIRAHEVLSPLTTDQHAQLIVILEKRLPPDSQIRADYFASRGPKPIADETWKQAFSRFLRCVGTVRNNMLKIRQYGDANAVYCYGKGKPLRNPPHETSPRRLEEHALSPRDTGSSHASILLPRTCNSCGIPDHDRPECPYLNRGDSNRDVSTDWLSSTIGQLWLSHGFSCYHPKLSLPGHSNVVIPSSSSSDSRGVRFRSDTNQCPMDNTPREDNRQRQGGQSRYRRKQPDPVDMMTSSYSSLHSHRYP